MCIRDRYGGQQIKIAFQADDPPSNDGLWYAWFIDNLYIGNAIETVRFSGAELTSTRSKVNLDRVSSETIIAPSPSRAAINGIRDVQPTATLKTTAPVLSLIHISEPTRLLSNSYAVFCLKKKKQNK